jgi:hypothetical protein
MYMCAMYFELHNGATKRYLEGLGRDHGPLSMAWRHEKKQVQAGVHGHNVSVHWFSKSSHAGWLATGENNWLRKPGRAAASRVVLAGGVTNLNLTLFCPVGYRRAEEPWRAHMDDCECMHMERWVRLRRDERQRIGRHKRELGSRQTRVLRKLPRLQMSGCKD